MPIRNNKATLVPCVLSSGSSGVCDSDTGEGAAGDQAGGGESGGCGEARMPMGDEATV